MALKGATYMQSALEGSWLMPNNLLKLRQLFSRPCLNSLPCGEGLGVGVVVILLGVSYGDVHSGTRWLLASLRLA